MQEALEAHTHQCQSEADERSAEFSQGMEIIKQQTNETKMTTEDSLAKLATEVQLGKELVDQALEQNLREDIPTGNFFLFTISS